MPARLSLARRAATAARWPVGVGLTSWRYMWRTTPMSRSESPGPDATRPPPFPAAFDRQDLQTPADGVGPLFHRRYSVHVAGAKLPARELIARMRDDIDAFAPSEFASFRRIAGDGPLATNEEWVVRMPGPWDGPVRVVEVCESSFRLATLSGHLEAGQIEFRAAEGGDILTFTIESWARSADRLSNLLYTHVRMAKEVQLHMWVSVLERVIEAVDGRRDGHLEIETRVIANPLT